MRRTNVTAIVAQIGLQWSAFLGHGHCITLRNRYKGPNKSPWLMQLGPGHTDGISERNFRKS